MTVTAPEAMLRRAVAPLTDVEWRDATSTGDGSYTLTGYAAVFGEETTLWDSRYYRLREQIQRGAFTSVLTDPGLDCHLVIGHNMDLPMARVGVNGVGGLELAEDDRGLRVFARLDPEISYIKDLSRLMRAGVVDQMSFAFTVAEDVVTSTDDGELEDVLRTITRIGELYDVTVCPRGAYPQTSATVRSLEKLGRTSVVGLPSVVVAPGGVGDSTESAVAPPVGVGGVSSSRLVAARLRARMRAGTHHAAGDKQ